MATEQVHLEYQWWGLEDTTFKGDVVYEIVARFNLEEHVFKDWYDFEQKMPHMAYAWAVATRFDNLERLFIHLRMVPQMLGVEPLPVKSTVEDISRHQWLMSIQDLALYRFSSIRDVSLHFVNDLLEIGLGELELNIGKIKKAILQTHPNVIAILKEINQCGRSVREDRNSRAHEGTVTLGTKDDEIFRIASAIESFGGRTNKFDIEAVYREAVDDIYKRFVSETNTLQEKVKTLVDSLLDEFNCRYDARRPT